MERCCEEEMPSEMETCSHVAFCAAKKYWWLFNSCECFKPMQHNSSLPKITSPTPYVIDSDAEIKEPLILCCTQDIGFTV
ncbi:unnamed protein product [Thelazia callipaeda]|uniref:EB domain-containing protein n=1 Tax=Thelazia callipaeda TaxID=103827 RepID=A0A0N5CL44_THECL|nr:unnamed protein product [Thelazia callipaeda]